MYKEHIEKARVHYKKWQDNYNAEKSNYVDDLIIRNMIDEYERVLKENAELKNELDSLQAVYDLVLSEQECTMSNCELQTRFETKEKIIEILSEHCDDMNEIEYNIMTKKIEDL